jgi:uncharacterized protein YfeS/predicted DNA-binding WGR domain protein
MLPQCGENFEFVMMPHMRYELCDESSNKFWEISLVESQLHIAWGAIDTAGRTQVKSFTTVELATCEMEKLTAEKLKKGYQLAGSESPAANVRYFDDEDEGLAKATSHPNFVALAPEDFYYDCGDDFSPFGSDDGSDTLSSLEEWYQDGGKDVHIMRFLKEFLEDWDFGLPKKIIHAEPAVLEKWLKKDEMNPRYLIGECRARVATAFGQLKITGTIINDCLEEAVAALHCSLWLNDRALREYPDWEPGTAERERLLIMHAALKKFAEVNHQ